MKNTIANWKSVSTKDVFLEKSLRKIKENSSTDIFNTSSLFFSKNIISTKIGAGLSKINVHTISGLSVSFANRILKSGKKTTILLVRGNRNNSKYYFNEIRDILSAMNVKVYTVNSENASAGLSSFIVKKNKLSGAIIIGSDNNGKDVNGISFLNEDGERISRATQNSILDSFKKMDTLNFKKTDAIAEIIDTKIVDEYIKSISQAQPTNSNLKTVITNHGGVSIEYSKTLFQNNDVTFIQDEENPDFKRDSDVKSENGKSLNYAISQSRKINGKVVIGFDTMSNSIAVAVKHKRRYKYLLKFEMNALFLENEFSRMKQEKLIPKNGYIVVLHSTSDLINKIAAKYNIAIERYSGDSEELKNIILKNKKMTPMFSMDSSENIIINQPISGVADGLYFAKKLLNISNQVFEKESIDLYQKIKNTYNTYGFHRSIIDTKNVLNDNYKSLIKRMKRTKIIAGVKVKSVTETSKTNDFSNIKIELSNNSWIHISREANNKAVIRLNVNDDTFNNWDNVMVFEREVSKYINLQCSTYEPKEFRWKTVFKYTIFLAILVGIFYFVFSVVYDIPSNNIFEDISKMTSTKMLPFWIIFALNIVYGILFGAWTRYRMFKSQNVHIKFRILVTQIILGRFISYVTPLAIGGDSIGYWYLRRRGVSGTDAASGLISATALYQISLVWSTIVILPFGWESYVEIFKEIKTNPLVMGVFIMFISGIVWNIFSTFMIISLATSKIFQNWIIKTSLHLLEWMPMIIIEDPRKKGSIYRYELTKMRSSMHSLWTNKKTLFEMMFYMTFRIFFSITFLALFLGGFLNENMPNGGYVGMIVGSDISSTANTFSLTPGGAGFSEWLRTTIADSIYDPSNIDPTWTGAQFLSIFDVYQKQAVSWPYIVMSAFLIVTVIIGESKQSKFNLNNPQGAKTKQFNYYKKASAVWFFILAAYIFFFIWLTLN